jgi:hypothetical protein
MFVAAAISGRLSERVPVRWLIGPALALVCAGLLFMTGLTGDLRGAPGSVVLVRRRDFASRRPVAEITEEPGRRNNLTPYRSEQP